MYGFLAYDAQQIYIQVSPFKVANPLKANFLVLFKPLIKSVPVGDLNNRWDTIFSQDIISFAVRQIMNKYISKYLNNNVLAVLAT